MGKEDEIIGKLRIEETALYKILLEMLKKIKKIIPLVRQRPVSITTYVLLFNHLRKIRAHIKSFDERVADIKEFEREINKQKNDINEFCKSKKLVYETYQFGDEPIRIDSDLNECIKYEIKDKTEKERIDSMLTYMGYLNHMFLHFGRPLGTRPDPKFTYENAVGDFTGTGFKKHHYQFAILVAQALIIIKKIIKLLQLKSAIQNRTIKFINRKIIPTFRTELELIKRHYPDITIKQETETLSLRLRELSSLV